jgi:hypothetical protein
MLGTKGCQAAAMHWTAHQIADLTLVVPSVHDAFDYVTLGIASVGAITGIAALGATFGLFFLSGPRLKVIAGTGLSTVDGVWGVSVTATNRGRTAAVLDGGGLLLGPNKEARQILLGLEIARGFATGPAFPYRLEPYATATWWIPAQKVFEILRQQGDGDHVRPFVTYANDIVRARKMIDVANIAKFG